MSRRFMFLFFGALIGLGFAFVMTLAALSPVGVSAQTVSCDTSHSVDGAASPPYGTVGTTITFTATGFTGGEAVSFWFTTPNGAVVGTAQPIPGGVNPNGTVGPIPFTITQSFLSVGEGRWAITFEGASSHHQSIIYFCVFSAANATAISQPTAAPTNTSAPPTATTAATEVPTSAPATEVPTEVATATTEVLPTSTTALETATVAPVVETPVPPTVPVVPTATSETLPLPTSVVPGMPTTGNSDGTLPTALALVVLALGVLTAGWLLRRNSSSTR